MRLALNRHGELVVSTHLHCLREAWDGTFDNNGMIFMINHTESMASNDTIDVDLLSHTRYRASQISSREVAPSTPELLHTPPTQ